MSNVTVLIDQETFKKLSKIAEKKGKNTADEIAKALKKYIDVENYNSKDINEGKQYLTEDR
jgi:predicted transcriptional regulator